MNPVALYISVPIACFRSPYARTYAETLPIPAPSTLYGMLLSLVGEVDREVHAGIRLAYGLLAEPETSTVLRKMWRVKQKAKAPGQGENAVPDFQQLLTGVELALWVTSGAEQGPSLVERVSNALQNPGSVTRFGSLCLGESTHIVNDIRLLRTEDRKPIRFLAPVPEGDLSLPLWADHVASRETVWSQFEIRPRVDFREPRDPEFVTIKAPPNSKHEPL